MINCSHKSFDLISQLPLDDTVKSCQKITIDSGLNYPQNMDDLVVRFSLPSSPLVLDTNQIDYHLALSFVKADGTKPSVGTDIAMSCGAASAFRSCELWERGQVIRKYENYAYISHLTTLLNTDGGSDWYKTFGAIQGFVPGIYIK